MKEETENQVSGRYNLRRRKDQGEERPLEQKKTQPIVSLATPQQTSKTTDLEFGGRIGKKPIFSLNFTQASKYTNKSQDTLLMVRQVTT